MRRRGDFQEAIRVLESLRNNVISGRYWVVAHDTFFYERSMLEYRLGRIHEEAGDRDRAIAHFRAAREQWRDADPSFVPAQKTNEALRRLGVTD